MGSNVGLGRRAAGRALVIALAAAAVSACADGYGTIGAKLTPADRQMIVQTTVSALESSQTGQGVNWSNPESGHRGSVTPFRTYDGTATRPCRDFQQSATIDGRTGFAFDSACRQSDGTWRSENFTDLAGAISAAYADGQYARDYRYDPYDDWYPYYDYPYYWRHYPYSRYRHYRYGPPYYGYPYYRW